MKEVRILIVGAAGQVGYELTQALRSVYGTKHVVASDVQNPYGVLLDGPFEKIDVMQKDTLLECLRSHRITQVYHLAALLSANGEKDPQWTWKLNMEGLLNILEAARELKLEKVYWPSSIAVFGSDAPKSNTPQNALTNPITAYGITKLAGERWCEYYANRYKVDVRSIRYPGLIGYASQPGGGVTDYAVDIYTHAVQRKHYTCFLSPNTYLPMMYMHDAIRATLKLMEAPAENIKVRSSYNVSSMSFCPAQIAALIQHYIPELTISYEPDVRQDIANSWPQSIDDSIARNEWGWKHRFDLDGMTQDMLKNLAAKPIVL